MSGEAENIFWSKLSGVTPEVSASPLPAPQITTTPAPGLRGPKGLGPRTDYTRVNTGAPPAADAGANAQKSAPPMGAAMLPKVASPLTNEAAMKTTMAPRQTLNDMVKAAMAEGVQNASISAEAARQLGLTTETTKTASAAPARPADETVSTETAMKLASALEFCLGQIKVGAIQLPAAMGGQKVEMGKGPGALKVTQSPDVGSTPDDPGKAHNQGPTSGLQSTHGDAKTQIKNDMDHPSPQKMGHALPPYDLLRKIGEAEAAEKKETEGIDKAKKGLAEAERAHENEPENKKKEGSGDPLLDYIMSRPKTKHAEDATNPAHISAGSAVPPATSASGEAGGAPAGGQPQGPRHLIGSNEEAINFKRREAYAPRKSELEKYLTEPALTSATDKVLGQAWAHNEQAGPKIASAGDIEKIAAGRALLGKLAEAANQSKPQPRA